MGRMYAAQLVYVTSASSPASLYPLPWSRLQVSHHQFGVHNTMFISLLNLCSSLQYYLNPIFSRSPEALRIEVPVPVSKWGATMISEYNRHFYGNHAIPAPFAMPKSRMMASDEGSAYSYHFRSVSINHGSCHSILRTAALEAFGITVSRATGSHSYSGLFPSFFFHSLYIFVLCMLKLPRNCPRSCFAPKRAFSLLHYHKPFAVFSVNTGLAIYSSSPSFPSSPKKGDAVGVQFQMAYF